jgi:signal transduction histidine kinase/DNA-binding response OmpR family regulator
MSRILVVDDEPLIAKTLVDLLAQHRFPATTAASGEEALEVLAREGCCDLVILDVRLPGISGFETCARIREAHGPSLPIILLTAYGDPAAIRQGHDVGADDFLTKPVDTPSLVLKVRAFLRFKGAHDEVVRAREEAQAQARDLALLHEIGRDWSLIAGPEEFNRMVTQRLAGLIGAPVCLIALYDPATRVMSVALPAHGLPDEVARQTRYEVKPEYRSLWNFRSGRPYVSNRPQSDPRLVQEMVRLTNVQSVVLVPMLSEGHVLGLLVAANKPGGFTSNDVRLLSIFAGPAASFLRSRRIFDRQRRHADVAQRLSALAGDMAGTIGRAALIDLAVHRIQKDLGYLGVAFWSPDPAHELAQERVAGAERPAGFPADLAHLRWALQGGAPLQRRHDASVSELAVPVRAGERALGVLVLLRAGPAPFADEDVNILATLAGQLAVAIQKSESVAQTELMARQMATLYDLGLETSALRDLQQLFAKGAEEAGRLIRADHTSVLRAVATDDAEEGGELRIFAVWGRDPGRETYSQPVFKMGEGIAGRVARDRVPVMINDVEQQSDFVPRANPVSRLLCVPLTYYDQASDAPVLFGVLNATRRPGAPRFTDQDLEYVTRFAGQLSIAVANSMAFGAERERGEQLALVNALVREIAGNLSRDRILDTAVRRIQQAFHYHVAMIAVPDPEAGVHRVAAAATRVLPAGRWGSYPLHAGIIGRAIREKSTVLVPDVSQDPDYVPLVAATRSEVAIPILSGDEVVAVLNVESESRCGFSRSQVMTLETLADSIGIILRNAELFQAVERTNARLVELDRMKSELVNIVAHDFRAPLAGVLGHAELLEWKPEAPVQERLQQARSIIQAATHMASLVDKTLKTTRLEMGQFPFDFGLVDLGALVREVLARMPADGSHPVVAEIPEDPVPCWADRERLAEVVENLMTNAAKYSPDGGPVRVEVARDPDSATVRVADKGIGIEPAAHQKLFRPFSRIRDQKTAGIDGSGLGLYICERIVRAHGGRMGLESQPGEGSTFSFSIPLFGVTAQMRAPLVLVAAGDERTRREVRRVAQEQGFATHEVSDGVDAVEAAIRLVPAAVVMDRVLPRLGAEEVAARLKENVATTAIPLFALADTAELGGQSGLFDACVPKPLDAAALAAVLGGLAHPEDPGLLTSSGAGP